MQRTVRIILLVHPVLHLYPLNTFYKLTYFNFFLILILILFSRLGLKSHTGFRLVIKLLTLNDLERRNDR